MEVPEIQYFLAMCDTLPANRAAERCHVSQPALTRAAAVATCTWSAELAV
jgi:DNA-binding transcriptional LysR family regulator